MFEYCSWAMLLYTFFRSIRSSRGLVYTYVRDLGHPWLQGPQLPDKAISRISHHMSPFQ